MKLSAKDLEMVANTIVDAIYDDNYVSKVKQKKSAEMWKEFKNDKKVKDLVKILDNQDIDCVQIKNSFFDWTPAEKSFGDNSYYYWDCYIYWLQSIENKFRERCESKMQISYPYRSQIFMDVKSQLVIECIGWKDLKKAIEGIQKEMKQKLDLLSKVK